jgi:hypothetical protein
MPPALKYFPDEAFVANKATKFIPALERHTGASLRRFRLGLVLHIVLGYALYLSAVFAAVLLSLAAIYGTCWRTPFGLRG